MTCEKKIQHQRFTNQLHLQCTIADTKKHCAQVVQLAIISMKSHVIAASGSYNT